jgi:hypothetical protein
MGCRFPEREIEEPSSSLSRKERRSWRERSRSKSAVGVIYTKNNNNIKIFRINFKNLKVIIKK